MPQVVMKMSGGSGVRVWDSCDQHRTVVLASALGPLNPTSKIHILTIIRGMDW